MKPAAFDYVVADSIDMAVVSLAEAGGDALSASSWLELVEADHDKE